MTLLTSLSRRVLAVVVLAVFPLIDCAHIAQPVRASAVTIGAFYTTDQAAYTNWDGSTPPTRSAAFPAGTKRIYYYIAYNGAAPSQTKLQVTLHNPGGSVSLGTLHTAQHQEAAYFGSFVCVIACRSGTYRFELSVYTPGRLANGRSTATAFCRIASGLVVSIHAISVTDLLTSVMATHYVGYSRVGVFTVTTPYIPIEFTYAGAVPHRTRWQIVMRTSKGTVYLRYPHSPAALKYPVGWNTQGLDNVAPWPPDLYHLDLELNGKIVASTQVLVQPTALGVCTASRMATKRTVLYASSVATYASWPGANLMPPAPITAFRRGTSGIAWYLRYAGGKAGDTNFQVTLEALKGGPSFTSQLYTARCAREAWMGIFTYDHPLPSGLYRLSTIVDGQPNANFTDFRVG